MHGMRTVSEEPYRGRHTSLASMSKGQLVELCQSLQRQVQVKNKEFVGMHVIDVCNRKIHGNSHAYQIIWGKRIWTSREHLKAFNCLDKVDALDKKIEAGLFSPTEKRPSELQFLNPESQRESIERSLTPDRAAKYRISKKTRKAGKKWRSLQTIGEKSTVQNDTPSQPKATGRRDSGKVPPKVVLDSKRKAMPYDRNSPFIGRLPPDHFLKKRKPNFPPIPIDFEEDKSPPITHTSSGVSASSCYDSELEFSGEAPESPSGGGTFADIPIPQWILDLEGKFETSSKFPDFSHVDTEEYIRDNRKGDPSNSLRRAVSAATYRTAQNPTAFLKRKMKDNEYKHPSAYE